MPNPRKGKTTKTANLAPYLESSQADVDEALARIRAFVGVARIDGHQLATGFLRLDWRGVSHPGWGVIVTTRSWERYLAVYKLALAALRHEAEVARRKPPTSARPETVVPSQRKRR
jgi:hypothetical protein